jgi:hypothetical protein
MSPENIKGNEHLFQHFDAGLSDQPEGAQAHRRDFRLCKEIGGLLRTRKRGVDRVGLSALLILSSYNLVRMAKLLGSPPRPTTLGTA